MVAVTWGTPMPRTSRLVHAAPGPTPTSRPAMPVSINSSAAPNPTQLPTTTGSLGDYRSEPFRQAGRRRYCRIDSGGLDLVHSPGNQIIKDRRLVELLHELG